MEFPSLEDISNSAKESFNEAKNALTEKGDALLKEGRYYLSEEYKKDTILNDLDAQHCTKVDHAAEVLRIFEETNDIQFVESYLLRLPDGAGATLPPDLQIKLAQKVERSRPKGEYAGQMMHRKTLCIVNQTLPAAAKKNQERYTEGLSSDYLHYDQKVPDYIAGLDPSIQEEIFKSNPLAYARTFPDSRWVEGDVLKQVVEEDFSSLWNYMESLDGTLCGQANYGEIPGSSRDMFDGHLLANPNLTPELINKITSRLAETYNYQKEEGEIDKNSLNYITQRCNVNCIVGRLLAHQNTGPNSRALIEKTFPTEFLSLRNNRQLGRTEDSES